MATKEFKGTNSWIVDCAANMSFTIRGCSGDAIEDNANYNLIKAAPKLLESLQELYGLLDEHEPLWYLKKHHNKAKSAISSALGA